MATDFNISPYYDDYFAANGGLDKNYYKVLFRPGRALQARELTTAQTILQNQIGSFGRGLFPEGAVVYGGEKNLQNPLPFVKLADNFSNLVDGDIIQGTTTGIKAVVHFSQKAEDTDPSTLWVRYITSNNDEPSIQVVFTENESLVLASNTQVQVGVTAASAATGSSAGIGVSVGESIVFTKELFVKTSAQKIILSKYNNNISTRIGYVVTDKIAGSSINDPNIDTIDVSLKDNASGYINYSADGADRQKVELVLCDIGYEAGWENNVSYWRENRQYLVNKKVRIEGSNEVYICVKDHYSTTGGSTNKPNTALGEEYWVSVKSFIEVGRLNSGSWSVKIADNTWNTTDDFLKILNNRIKTIWGDFTIKPFGLKISENDTDGIKLESAEIPFTTANTAELLLSIDYGHAFKDGKEIITQKPENFVIPKTRTLSHVKTVNNFSPDVNYGNYLLVERVKGIFNFQEHETVTFYNTSRAEDPIYWNNTENILATAKIRYFDLHSGRPISNCSIDQPAQYKAYIYDYVSTASGEPKAIEGARGEADIIGIEVQYAQQAGTGEINYATANVYGQLFETGSANRYIFDINPNYVRTVNSTLTDNEPILYTQRDFNAKLIKEGNTYKLFNAVTSDYFKASDFGAILGKGLIDPGSDLSLAESNYTIYNLSAQQVKMDTCDSECTIDYGMIFPIDNILAESGCKFAWVAEGADARLEIYFTIPVEQTELVINDIVFRVKMGLSSVDADTKTYIPCNMVTVESSANTTNQGYDSSEISFCESDIYSLDAIYEVIDGNYSLPYITLSDLSGMFLKGEMVKEYDTSNVSTELTGRFVANTVANTEWTYIVGDGSINGNYFTIGNTIKGTVSGATGVVANNAINAGYRDITERYILDKGQRDNYYDWSKIKLKKGKPAPTNPIVIVYSKFVASYASGEKKFFSVDSYGAFNGETFTGNFSNNSVGLTYSQLPVYNSNKLGNLNLRDCIDFRPIRSANSAIILNGDLSNGTYAEIVDRTTNWLDDGLKVLNPSPLVEDLFTINYEHFLDRKDIITLNKNYQFEVVSGIPGSSSYPVIGNESMPLWRIAIPPYLDSLNLIEKVKVSNKAYNMKDIGDLDTRLTVLEKQVRLNSEEIKALAKPEPSLSELYIGLERFKNGILLDTFKDHSVGDVQDKDYMCSIEPGTQIMRAPFESNAIDVDLFNEEGTNYKYHPINSETYVDDNGQTVTRKNGLVTLDYATAFFIDQQEFSGSISVNPFNIIKYVGKIKLNPESDNWVDTEILPDVEIDLSGDADAWNALASGVNDRMVIKCSSSPTAPNFKIGSTVLSSDGGTGIVSEIEDNVNVVLTDYEGKFSSSNGTLTGIRNDNTSLTVSILDTWTRGGALGFGTEFGDWQTTWTGVDVTATSSTSGLSRNVNDTQVTVRTDTRTGASTTSSATINRTQTGSLTTTRTTTSVTDIQSLAGQNTSLTTELITTSFGEFVKDISIIPYMREKIVLFEASSLKPNTIHYPFFNGVNVSNYCATRTYNTTSNKWEIGTYGETITTSSTGTVYGVFKIPAGVFTTGERTFRLIDTITNLLSASTTYAEAQYSAQGLKQTKVENIVSTRTPALANKYIEQERKVTTSDTVITQTENWTALSQLQVIRETFTSAEPVVIAWSWPSWGFSADPLAQSFLIDPAVYTQGLFITSIDIFVSSKPKDSSFPLNLEVRTMVNGYPSQYILPGADIVYNHTDGILQTYYNNDDMSLTITTTEEHNLEDGQKITLLYDNGYVSPTKNIYSITVIDRRNFFISDVLPSENNENISPSGISKINIASEATDWAPTRFVFDYPVYLKGGEFAFVVASHSAEYECLYSIMGEQSWKTGSIISSQPYLGSMFKSQNATTWTAAQESDLAFRIKKAVFVSNQNADIIFTQNDASLNEVAGITNIFSDNFNLKYNLLNLQAASIRPEKTLVSWALKTQNDSDNTTSWINNIVPGLDNEFLETKKVVKASESLQVKATISTTDNNVSPVIDTMDQRVIIVENIINNTSRGEWLENSGAAQARYISRSVILEEGMDAADLKVYLKAAKTKYNSTADIICYCKLIAGNDNTELDNRFWYPMIPVSDPGYSSSKNDFRSYAYKMPKNIWFVDEGDDMVSVYYTGDGNVLNNEYNENIDGAFDGIDLNAKVLEHVYYDTANESITYTYYDGTTDYNKVASYTDFKQFTVKLVMMSSNKSQVPLIKELKALALT